MKTIISIVILSSFISGTAMATDWSSIKKSINNVQMDKTGKQLNTRGFFFCIPCII